MNTAKISASEMPNRRDMLHGIQEFSPRPLICDGNYAHHFAHNVCAWQGLPVGARLAVFAAQVSRLTRGPKLWAWDSPEHAIHRHVAELLPALGFAVERIPDRRADDIIASQLSSWPDAVIVSSDRDIQSLATESADVLCHVSGWDKLHTAKEIAAKWGVDQPAQILDVLAWAGDDVDGIEGIPGVGLELAKKLAKQGDSVELAYADEIPVDWEPYRESLSTLCRNYLQIMPHPGLRLSISVPNRQPASLIRACLERLQVPSDLADQLVS